PCNQPASSILRIHCILTVPLPTTQHRREVISHSFLCAAMADKFTCAQTQAAYRKRKWLSEPPNAWVKSVLGFRQFSMRGLAKAQAEWKLVCAALNLRRMSKMTPA
ncbi:transposase, partial [Caballeronia calidae]|uniref:transposase n=1 Tax=Caballeronia calidae TaxID=1777139 RepID=UPI001E3EC12E